ncbi:hypothetical protein OKW21_006052 [Catalinimonas alkaloidigena]|uniref:hypothetical protein n=1 Tax=Catalinimonas alkaloidigena TaxID=1075417 RepID=UPI00240717CB|nr:hypothetical protein [Catalinimonas alkaloidigena]MDF9800789.1 hypothetical protein [Catalinimonas alkaloidigena]
MASYSTKKYFYRKADNTIDAVNVSVQIDDCDNNCGSGSTYECLRHFDISVSSGVTTYQDEGIPIDFREFWTVDSQGDGSSVITGETYFKLTYTGSTLPQDFYKVCYEYNDPSEITREHFYLDQQSIPEPASEITIDNIEVTDVSSSGATDGALAISASTNVTPDTIEYSIDSGSTYFSTSGFTGLAAGDYDVFVRNVSGTTANDTATVGTSSGTTGDTGTTTTDNIIVESQPALLTASENPILVSLSSKILDDTPSYSKTDITVSNNISDGDYIQFKSNNIDIKLTAKDDPSFAEFFTTSGNTLGDVANSLRFAINDHPILNKLYYANSSGATVTVTSKKVGSKYELIPGDTLIDNSTGISSTLIQSGSSKFVAETKSDYGYYVNIYVENEADELEYIKTIEQPYVLPRNHFDLAGILKNYVNTYVPSYQSTGFTKSTNHLKKYDYDLGELYAKSTGGYKFQYPFETSGITKYVLNASLPLPVQNTLSVYNQGPFLSNAPDLKPVHSEQKDYLYFVTTNGVTDVSIKYRFYFFDHTQTQWRTLSTESITGSGVYYFESSPSVFSISSEPKSVWKIEVKLQTGGSEFNQVQTYELSVEESDTGFDVLFQNSLGAFESFRFVGEVTDSITRTVSNYNRSYYGKLSTSDSITSTKKVVVQNVYELNSGIVSTETFNWLKELIKSSQIYINKNDSWVSVTTSNVRYEKSTDEDFYSISLSITESIPENSISQ